MTDKCVVTVEMGVPKEHKYRALNSTANLFILLPLERTLEICMA